MVEKNEFGSKTSDQPSLGPEEQKPALNRSGLVNKKTWTDNLMIFIIFNLRDDPPYLTLATRAKVKTYTSGHDLF